MNFQDLLTKIRKIDEAPMEAPTVPLTDPTDDDAEFAECGDMSPTSVMPRDGDDMLTGECGDMAPQMSAPKQSDSVTMNVSMNGSGAGGIKDLLDIRDGGSMWLGFRQNNKIRRQNKSLLISNYVEIKDMSYLLTTI